MDYTASIVASANAHGVDPNLALAVANAESSMNPNALSGKGAVGLFQLMPSSFPGVNIYDTQTNIDTGVSYLSKLLGQYNGDTSLALAAYNAGPGNVAKYGGIPPFTETQNYVASIMASLGISTADSGSMPVDTTGGLDTSGLVSMGIDPTGLAMLGAGAFLLVLLLMER